MVVPVDTPQTVELLRQKGLRCVCELCDCGRPHKHRGCLKERKESTRPGLMDAKTNYQATYTPKHCSFNPRHLRKPLPRMRNPHPPPMDFRTTNRTEIVPVSLAERQGPVKQVDSYEPSSEKLDGKTVYMQDYENRGPPDVVRVTRPKTMLAPQAKFYSNTTHNDTFTAKKPIYQPAYGEIPSFVGSILFPEAQEKVVRTVNQETYKGKFVPRVETMKPKQAQITLGTEGSYDHQTMHKEMFKKIDAGEKAKRIPRGPTLKIEKRAKFQDQTQHKSDFPGHKGAPAKAATPPPDTLQIAYSKDRALNTTNRDEYKITWDPSKIRMAKSMKKDDDEYHPPTEKFSTQTQSMVDFQPKSVGKITQVRPVSQYTAPMIKFRDDTSYGTHFPKHAVPPRVRYGEVPVHSVHLKPIEKFAQDGSVTTRDFKTPQSTKRRSPFKPTYTMHIEEGKIEGETVYRAEFVPKKADMCKFKQWLVEHEARHKAEMEMEKSTQVILSANKGKRKPEAIVTN